MNWQDITDEWQAKQADFLDNYSKYLNFPITLFRWGLNIIAPVIFGAFLETIIQQYLTGSLVIDIPTVLKFWPLYASGTLTLAGIFWRIHTQNREIRLDRVYFSMRWLFHDLGLDEANIDDVRCTLWTPVISKVDPEKMVIIQLVNYYPRIGKASEINEYRINKHHGRRRRIARVINNKVKPIGVVGLSVIDSIKNHKPTIIIKELSNNVNFKDYMVNKMNFTMAEAKRLTQDRRSYLCIVLMNSPQTDVLGILFMDAKRPHTFTKEFIAKIQPNLPRIAEVLTI